VPLKKVIIYVTRKRAGRDELLVFEHRDFPAAGLQVPAGTMDPGEAAVDAAARELMEESGLSNLSLKGRVDVYEWLNPETSRLHRRHVYHFVVASELSDAWDHTVSAGEDDQGLVFRFRWMPLAEAEHALAGDQGRSISRIL
jgi:8-oxo-dGTP pyrophosphatase MutT (NUDIX family)